MSERAPSNDAPGGEPDGDVCPHCGAVMDVQRALAEDDAALGRGARPSRRGL